MVMLTAAVFAVGKRTTNNKGGMADEFCYFIIILLIQLIPTGGKCTGTARSDDSSFSACLCRKLLSANST